MWFQRRLKDWEGSKQKRPVDPPKFIDRPPERKLSANEKQIKNKAKVLGKTKERNRQLKRENEELKKTILSVDMKALKALCATVQHESGASLAAKVNKIKGNNYEILDMIKRIGIKGIVNSTYKNQAAKAMDLAKFLDKIIPLEDKAADGLIDMEDKGRVPRTGKKEDMEKPVTFEVSIKPRPAMDDFEAEINEIQKGNDDE
jgi:hypothetical protein